MCSSDLKIIAQCSVKSESNAYDTVAAVLAHLQGSVLIDLALHMKVKYLHCCIVVLKHRCNNSKNCMGFHMLPNNCHIWTKISATQAIFHDTRRFSSFSNRWPAPYISNRFSTLSLKSPDSASHSKQSIEMQMDVTCW